MNVVSGFVTERFTIVGPDRFTISAGERFTIHNGKQAVVNANGTWAGLAKLHLESSC